jgi:hypothetical protein
VPDSNFEPIQSVVVNLQENLKGKESQYFKGDYLSLFYDRIIIKKNGTRDLVAYFNVFNLGKWERHIGIKTFFLRLNLSGRCRVGMYRHLGSFQRQDCRRTPAGEERSAGDCNVLRHR